MPDPGPETAKAPRGKLAVLDDEPFFCDFVIEMAEISGYDAFAATRADEFFAHIAHTPVSVIVLDLKMPGTDGLSVLRRLAESGVKANVLLASGADGKVMETAMRLGREHGLNMTGIVQKPIDGQSLRRLLEAQGEAEEALTASRLATAIEGGEMALHYQPILDLRSDRIVAVEALARWHHPRLGMVMPHDFVPMAEVGGQIVALTEWALAEAVRQAAVWRRAGLALKVSVNISNAGLPDDELPAKLERLCADAGVPPSALVLELTESAAMADAARVMEICTRLRLRGFDLSIDDFGTGHSSLAQLQRLPFSALKIDRSFVGAAITSANGASIVQAIIGLAHAMGLHCVAEGVESPEMLAFLKDSDCDFAQGFHIARPLPAAEIPGCLQ